MTWRYRFKLRDLITPKDVNDETATALGTRTAERLRRSTVFGLKICDELAEVFSCVRVPEDFNRAFDKLYDAADAERVWIE